LTDLAAAACLGAVSSAEQHMDGPIRYFLPGDSWVDNELAQPSAVMFSAEIGPLRYGSLPMCCRWVIEVLVDCNGFGVDAPVSAAAVSSLLTLLLLLLLLLQ
jgi:hypothetical protein